MKITNLLSGFLNKQRLRTPTQHPTETATSPVYTMCASQMGDGNIHLKEQPVSQTQYLIMKPMLNTNWQDKHNLTNLLSLTDFPWDLEDVSHFMEALMELKANYKSWAMCAHQCLKVLCMETQLWENEAEAIKKEWKYIIYEVNEPVKRYAAQYLGREPPVL